MRTHVSAIGIEPALTVRERLTLDTLRRQGEITRAQLMQITGLSGPQIFRVTEDLMKRGLILIGEPVAAGRGQPSNRIRVRPEARATLGLAIMTDHAEALLMDFSGTVRARRDIGTADMKRAQILGSARAFLQTAAADAAIPENAVLCAGLAIAGYFTGMPGAANPAAELDDWALIDLQEEAGQVLGVPVIVENIANASAVGEQMLGVGASVQSFVYLNFAHGIGAGLIEDGKLIRGRYGNAGEVGAMLAVANLPSPGLAGLQQTLADHGVETGGITDLVTRFQITWPGVEEWVVAHAPSVSYLANTLRYALDYEAIILGGRLPPTLAARLASEIRWLDDLKPPRRGAGWPLPAVLTAGVSASAAAVGAAALGLQRGYFG